MITATIIKNSIRNNLHSPTNIISYFLLVFLLAGIADYLGIRLILIPAIQAQADPAHIRHITALILYATSLFSLAMNQTVLTVRSLVLEKTRRMHETLLAGPVDTGHLWWGKSLAIFLPGYLASLFLSGSVYLILQLFFISPVYGWLLSPQIILIPLALIPGLYFCLGLLLTLISLIADPVHANVIGQVFLPGLASISFNLGIRRIMDTHRPGFFIFHLALCAALLLAIILVRPRLNKQRVILSGRKK